MQTQITTPVILDHGTQPGSVSSKATNSISPQVGELIQVFVFNKAANNTLSHVPTLSGLGITWHQITTVQSTFSSGEWRTTEFVGVITSATSGAITIDFSGQNQDGAIAWAVLQYPNNVKVNIASPQDAIVQTASSQDNTTQTSESISMGAFSNPNNGTVACFTQDGQGAFSTSNNMTVLVNDSTGYGSICICWSPTNISTPQINFAGSNGTGKVNLASEIAFKSRAGGFIL